MSFLKTNNPILFKSKKILFNSFSRSISFISHNKKFLVLLITLISGEIISYYIPLTVSDYANIICSIGITTHICMEAFCSIIYDNGILSPTFFIDLFGGYTEWIGIYAICQLFINNFLI